MIDRPLKVAFLFSIGLHSILFSPLLDFISHPTKTNNTNIEVTYIDFKNQKDLTPEPIPLEDVKTSLQEQKEVLKKEAPSSKTQKKDSLDKAKDKAESLPKEYIKDAYPDKKTIDLNSLSLKKGESDSLNYLRAVRNKIDLYVHRNYTASMGEGEVFLHFVLNPDGTVQSASIIKDNLENNDRLKKLCLDSIYLSSPFKPFPQDLNLPQARFNIRIFFNKK